LNRLTRDMEEPRLAYRLAEIRLQRAWAKVKELEGKSAKLANGYPDNWREINNAINEVNRLMRDTEEWRLASRLAEIRLSRARAKVAALQGKSAGRGLPKNVVPMAVSATK
jgi:hypothetical protein